MIISAGLSASSDAFLTGDSITLSNSSSTTGVDCRSNMEIDGTLQTNGSVFGRNYSNVQFSLKASLNFILGDLNYSSTTMTGSSSFSAAISLVNINNILNIPYNAGIKKIMLRNFSSGSIGGILRIYKIDSGLDPTIDSNYTLVTQNAVVVGSFGIQNITISNDILIDAEDSIIFLFERVTGVSSQLFANAIMMYDIT